MAPYHQIKTLKTQKQKLSQDLSDALNDLEDALDDLDEANNGIRLLESKNDCLEGRIQDLQMQLEQYQEKNNQNEVLLKEQDDIIAEYLKVIIYVGQAWPEFVSASLSLIIFKYSAMISSCSFNRTSF